MINPTRAIAFCGSSSDITEATEKLKYHKINAESLHGSNVKMDRKKTMEDFKAGRLQILVASDLAARGLDIDGITHIINVDIPERSMEYLHRAGRTGRNGKSGMTISIVTEHEIEFIKQYEKELKIKITPKSMSNGVMVAYKREAKKKSIPQSSGASDHKPHGQSDTRHKPDGKSAPRSYNNNKPTVGFKQDSKPTTNSSSNIKPSTNSSPSSRPSTSDSPKRKPMVFRRPK